MNNKVREAFSKINVPKSLDNKVFNGTIKRIKLKNLYFKYVVSILLIIICITPMLFIKTSNNDIEDIDIYMNVSNNEFSWAYDVSDPLEIVFHADYVVKIKVLDVGKGTYKYSNDNRYPATPIEVQTLEVLKGSKNRSITEIVKWGGSVTIENVIKNKSPSINKMELDKLGDIDKKTKYIKFELVGDYDFEVGNTYIVALKESDGGVLFVGANGYSVFLENGDVSNYVNVITGKKYNEKIEY